MLWFYSFWKFVCLYMIIGILLSVLVLYIIVMGDCFNFFDKYFFLYSLILLLIIWISCLCGNIYIVGLN